MDKKSRSGGGKQKNTCLLGAAQAEAVFFSLNQMFPQRPCVPPVVESG